MKNLLAVLLLLTIGNAYGLDANAVTGFNSTILSYDGVTKGSTKGGLQGITHPPTGYFKLNVVNSKKYRGVLFNYMECTILPYEDVRLLQSSARLVLVQYGKNKNALGFYGGASAFPTSTIKVSITEGGSIKKWNTLNCAISNRREKK